MRFNILNDKLDVHDLLLRLWGHFEELVKEVSVEEENAIFYGTDQDLS